MKILLPTDGSEHSETAVKFLKRLNLSSDDEITILYVISDDPFQDKEDYYYTKIQEIKQLIAPKVLDSAVNILKTVLAKIGTTVMNGHPDECIVKVAVDSDTNIIIMGPKRLRGIRSRIVGSVTKAVSIRSPKPVLVIKPSHGASSDRLKILFASDGSDNARMAGETLSLMPFPDDTEITILNVITPAFYDIPDRFMTKIDTSVVKELKKFGSAEPEKSQKIISEASGYLRKRFQNINALTKTGDPTDEILQSADELKTDIIVLGSKGMGGFKGVVGSVSRYILSAAECSVLIGKVDSGSRSE